MLPIAFTESVELRDHIREIDTLRVRLLTIPLPPKTEMKLRWEAKATRIHSSLTLCHTLLSRGQIVKILGAQTRHIPSEYKSVVAYKKALDYIQDTWVASSKPLTLTAVATIAELALSFQKDTIDSIIKPVEMPIKATIDYLENTNDHPIIQAGIALCLLSTSAKIPGDDGCVARLISFLYLSKYGYDCRGLLTVEKHWVSAEASYDIAIESFRSESSLNHWLLFYVQSIEENLRERIEDITNAKLHQDFPARFWELNDRQKTIISSLEEPSSSMTNSKVQKLFGISQITASRDLSKLTTLGLLFPHGKGRSISYTRT
jgi:hypothetical protein